MNKVLGVLAVVVIIVLVLFILFGKGIGFGSGSNSGDDKTVEDNNVSDAVNTEEIVQPVQEKEEESDETKDEEELPNRIIVTIKEDKVFIEDTQFEDAESLKEYLEEINTDYREFFLKDEGSILDTYEWVKEVFDELKITLNVES